jgi:hypothetical protein
VVWTEVRLVNRYDAWGAYRDAGRQLTCYGTLSRDVLVRHYQADGPGDIIGAHTADADNRSKGGALDIDYHGPTSTAPTVNLAAALQWYGMLARLGFHPLLTESNGRGGYHLRVLLSEAIPADRLFHFLRQLTADHRQLGFSKPPEQFPKQPDVRRCAKGLGNWIRLPGRHHKREFWSRVWDGSAWLAGHAAIDFMVGLKGDSPELVPTVPEPSPTPPPVRWTYPAPPTGGNLSARIAAFAARLPSLSEGQGRDDVAFHFACWLVRDLAVSDDIALEWLRRWDSKNRTPKGDDRLAEIIRSAHTYGQRPFGCGLAPKSSSRDRHGHLTLRATVEVS